MHYKITSESEASHADFIKLDYFDSDILKNMRYS